MLAYLLRRLLYGVLVMAGVVVLVFVLFQGFGDPTRLVMGQGGDAATQAAIRKELNLDQPKWKQLVFYINDIAPISVHQAAAIDQNNYQGIFIGGSYKVGIKLPYLRTSYQSRKPVTTILLEAFPGTLMLAVAAMLLAVALGIPLGVLAALKKGSWLDTTALTTSIVGISAPSFFMGIVVAYLFGFVWSQYTGLHLTGSWYDIDLQSGEKRLTLQNLVLPAFTLGIRPLSIITQLTRSALLDVLQQDFIRTAYAKGLSRQQVVWRHGVRNALNPVLTAVTGWFAELLSGAFFIEYIFGWQGIGKVTVDALEQLDFPVVMGSVLFTAAFFVAISILADLLYAWLDPRVQVH
ncbi:peptide/nickel transport system permease protein [Cnuella takakiae]|uniref:Peptide/nickel transport system permease protein n=1 Tax=Cnuella takakiae TaxID=1302690 RepID=A0A1M4V402_9BACT|nr:ABC transporter permease [Cnuella takakiae]OLY92715.1 ABC transporter permease [Cnuella takakiae]SHE63659.1 peptide/nickel transport system permease protein [Cnuella takakiae]